MPSRLAPHRPHATVVVGAIAALLVAVAVWMAPPTAGTDAAPSRAEIGASDELDSPTEAVVAGARAVDLRRALFVVALAAMVTLVAATVPRRDRPPSGAPQHSRVDLPSGGTRAPPRSRFA